MSNIFDAVSGPLTTALAAQPTPKARRELLAGFLETIPAQAHASILRELYLAAFELNLEFIHDAAAATTDIQGHIIERRLLDGGEDLAAEIERELDKGEPE
ncbi:hypothetical protein [Cryobacterium sp. TMT4-31]|uniref:hypothetical protein n=1 Tax=Cryobacterium sp. TMT4-31 TaxID=1259259 RepID=UPI00106A6021|nr:hypothetical protein [Cryobacterium sp. TMT4-31]TFC84857.1 hypothetical protein E3T19_17985 [Cryobacterium sp. TMT4-31]